MDDCIDLCPGDNCPSQCSGSSIGSPSGFADGFINQAQDNFDAWGGVTLVAAFVIGSFLSMAFGR